MYEQWGPVTYVTIIIGVRRDVCMDDGFICGCMFLHAYVLYVCMYVSLPAQMASSTLYSNGTLKHYLRCGFPQ